MSNDSGPLDGLQSWSGAVVSGSLTEGLEVRLDSAASAEDIKVGTLVTIEGERMRFFGQITDVSLATTDPALSLTPPDMSNPFVARVVSGTTAYGKIKVEPRLTLSRDQGEALGGPQPAKTVPAHFSRVAQATDRDIELVFGAEDERHFWIGHPLDMETKLCLDIAELVTRSNGVFGKSGTGKTFLTRLLLAGIVQSRVASNLVFDMHNEYGWKGSSEGGSGEVKGLKQLFGSKVGVFSLDEESTRRRGLTPDYVVRIGYGEIEAEDIQILRESLDLSSVAAESAYSLQGKFGARKWLKEFLDLKGAAEIGELANELNLNTTALAALHRRLQRLRRFRFMDEQEDHDSVGEILNYLKRGMHVVLEFGSYGRDMAAYILVANLLTRRIYDRYVQSKEQASTEGGVEPTPLVITIEEAHRFLTREVAGQTIFAAIAREMRKYNVTLLVVDQRPSGIDEEVMSQLGTKFAYLLDNERDVDAVLSGISGGRKLRSVLASLDSKQQALVFGHAVPMPVEIRTRDYGTPQSYKDLGFIEAAELHAKTKEYVEDLYGPAGG